MAEEYISPDDLHAQLDGPETPLIVDTRGAEDYDAGHILGAVHIPGAELPQRLEEIPINRSVVTYCNMHNRGNSRGESAAALLRAEGYEAVTLEGGYPAWQEAAYPTASL